MAVQKYNNVRAEAEPSRAEPNRPEPGRAEPSRAEPSGAEPGRAGPSRAEPSRADPGQAGPRRPQTAPYGRCHMYFCAHRKSAQPFTKKHSFYNELYTRGWEPFWDLFGTGRGQWQPSRAEPSRAWPGRAEPSRAEPSRAGPGRAEPRRAEPSLADLGRARPRRPQTAPYGHCHMKFGYFCAHRKYVFFTIKLNRLCFGRSHIYIYM